MTSEDKPLECTLLDLSCWRGPLHLVFSLADGNWLVEVAKRSERPQCRGSRLLLGCGGVCSSLVTS